MQTTHKSKQNCFLPICTKSLISPWLRFALNHLDTNTDIEKFSSFCFSDMQNAITLVLNQRNNKGTETVIKGATKLVNQSLTNYCYKIN